MFSFAAGKSIETSSVFKDGCIRASVKALSVYKA